MNLILLFPPVSFVGCTDGHKWPIPVFICSSANKSQIALTNSEGETAIKQSGQQLTGGRSEILRSVRKAIH